MIYLNHTYLHEKTAKYTDKEGYWVTKQEGNHSGQMLWDNLVSQVPNIRMVICGHTGRPSDKKDVQEDNELSVAYRVDKNVAGKPVHQMMFNVQTLGGGWKETVETAGSGFLSSCPTARPSRSAPTLPSSASPLPPSTSPTELLPTTSSIW